MGQTGKAPSNPINYSSVSKLNPFNPCEGCSALLIPALPCPISGVHVSEILHHAGFWKLSPPLRSSPRRGCCVANSDELVGRVPEGKTSSLTAVLLLIPTVGRAHVLCWKVVKHATKPNNLSRSRLWSQLAPVR